MCSSGRYSIRRQREVLTNYNSKLHQIDGAYFFLKVVNRKVIMESKKAGVIIAV